MNFSLLSIIAISTFLFYEMLSSKSFAEEANRYNSSILVAQGAGGNVSSEMELEFWNSVKDTNDPERLRAYIEKFPKGTFVPLARIKLEKLSETSRENGKQTSQRTQYPKADEKDCFNFDKNMKHIIEACSSLLNGQTHAKEKLASIYRQRAFAFKNEGEHSKATADFDQSIKLQPSYHKNYYKRGKHALWKLKDNDKAIADFNLVIDMKSDHDMAYSQRGIAYHRKGEFHSAIEDFTKAVEFNPKLDYYYSLRAETYVSLKYWEKAVDDYGKAIKLANAEFGTTSDKTLKQGSKVILRDHYDKRGAAHVALGEHQLADRDFRSARELDPVYKKRYEKWLRSRQRSKTQGKKTARRVKRCRYKQQCSRVSYPYTVYIPVTRCRSIPPSCRTCSGGTSCSTSTTTSTRTGYRNQCRNIRVCN